MFIYSVNAAKLKISALFLVFALCFAALCFLIPLGSEIYPGDVLTSVPGFEEKMFENIKEPSDRVNFLKECGWIVEETPKTILEVTIPSEFDNVYEKYNLLQKAQGLDLKRYKGKSAKLYTYVVTNYDYNGTVYANLLISDDRIIGGDVCSANKDGFIHGFSKENNFIS